MLEFLLEFLHSEHPDPILPHSYDPWLVTLSVVIAILASYTALDLAGQVTAARGRARYTWLLGGAMAMGTGIWSMYFVAMLAFQLPVPIAYDVALVVMSLLAAIFASGLALWIVSRSKVGWRQFVLGSLVMGAAIAGMHYIGMMAIRGSVIMHLEPIPVVLSIVIAVAASLAALWLQFRLRAAATRTERIWKALAAVVMGFAIVSMHYTGMFGSVFHLDESVPANPPGSIAVSVLGGAAITAGALILLLGYIIVRRYRSFSLVAKAAINLALLVAAVAFVSVAGATGLNNLNFQVDNLYNFMLIPINSLQEANRALSAGQELYHGMAASGLAPQGVEADIERIKTSDAKFQAVLDRYDAEWITTASLPFTQLLERRGRIDLQQDEVAAFELVKTKFAAYQALRDETASGLLSGQITPDELEEIEEASEHVEAEMDRLIQINLEFAQVSFDDAVEAYQTSTLVMIVTAIAVSLLGVGVLVVLLRSIILPLNALRETADQVVGGQLGATARVFANDEIGQVARTFNTMTSQLRDLIGSLEQRVADRTKALATSADVSRRLSTVLDPQQLVKEVVEQVRESFNYYHAHIYLFDERGENLIMAGGTGEAGRTMLERGHKLPAGRGLVGRAAATGAAVLVSDTTQDPNWLPNPLLPETKAEVAVPIMASGQVLGVLDVQQNVAGGLGQADVDLLQSLANQVAIALSNARSYEEARVRADLETRVNTISQKIQAAPSVEQVLEIAARELGQALGARRASVQLSSLAKSGQTRQN